jgi:hypothetical protein
MFFVLLYNVNNDAEAHTPRTVQPPKFAAMIAIEGKKVHTDESNMMRPKLTL